MREQTIGKERINFFKNFSAMFWASEPEEKNQAEEIETYKDEPEDSKKLWSQALKNVASMEKMLEVPTRKSLGKNKKEAKIVESVPKVSNKKKEQAEATLLRDTKDEEQDRIR